jgi:serine/threonine-protein kinase
MLLPIVKALTVAHAAGMVHRDVKPENVFLAKTSTGGLQPKLLDFGIAQLALAEHLTCSGSTMGSPEYMSPEQARGDDVDMSADTWALSVVLYEAITGKAPFFGRNYNVVIQNILTKEPAPWPDFGEGSEDLWRIVKKGLEKNRFDRWRTSKALGRALAGWLSDRGVSDDVTGLSLGAGWGERSTTRLRSVRQTRPGPWAFVVELTMPLASATRRAGRRNVVLLVSALVVAAAAAIGLSKLGNRSTPPVRSQKPAEPRTAFVTASSVTAQPGALESVRALDKALEDSAVPIEPTPSTVKPPTPRAAAAQPAELHSSLRHPPKSGPAPSPSPSPSSASPRGRAPSTQPFRNPFE